MTIPATRENSVTSHETSNAIMPYTRAWMKSEVIITPCINALEAR